MTLSTTVYLIDDDVAVLDALSAYLESRGLVVRRFARAIDALAALGAPVWPACVVSDVRMPEMSGLDLQRELARRGSTLPLILITGHGDIEMAVAAIKAGAHNFLEKPFDERVLLEEIGAAVKAAEHRHATTAEHADLRERYAALSERQRQVMDLAVHGRTNKEIGAELDISPRTVEIYRAKVMGGMGAANLADLVRMAMKLRG